MLLPRQAGYPRILKSGLLVIQPTPVNDHQSFPEMLRERATLHPSRPAVLFVDETGGEQQIDYGQLWQRCVETAGALAKVAIDRSASASAPRALLLFPPGLDFLPAFVGAQLAGWIPVPTGYPKPHRAMPRLDAAARDCQPAAMLCDAQSLSTLERAKLDPAAAALPTIAVDSLSTQTGSDDPLPLPPSDSIAFLQYTSGSTSEPKGVMVSQSNLMSNLETIRTSFQLPWQPADDPELTTAVFWLPHYHDMGLIGGMLAPLYLGYRTVLMSPQTFVRRPLRWLEAVDRFAAAVTGAPSFAYEWCADRITPQQAERLDLSSLQVAFCGAEPIRAAALRSFANRFAAAGFRPERYYPCYGLAEATLLAAGGKGPAAPRVLNVDRQQLGEGCVQVLPRQTAQKSTPFVSCGAAAGDMQLVIVDPQSHVPLPADQVGEIWLRGSSLTSGYWNRPEENASRFQATLAAAPQTGLAQRWFGSRWIGGWLKSRETAAGNGHSAPTTAAGSGSGQAERGFFRSGDLGFVHDGELFITGRLKDVIIIRGRNYFPQDLEATLSGLPELALGRVAALAVPGPRGESLAIVAEVARETPPDQYAAITRAIRRATIEEHEVDPRQVLLVRTATIPMTTSGKLQRSLCAQWVNSEFRGTLSRWQRSGGSESSPLPLPALPAAPTAADFSWLEDTLRQWIVQWLTMRGGVEPDEIQVDRRFDDYGLDSLMAIELIGDLEDGFEVELTPSIAWEHPTVAAMAALVAAHVCGLDEPTSAHADRPADQPLVGQ